MPAFLNGERGPEIDMVGAEHAYGTNRDVSPGLTGRCAVKRDIETVFEPKLHAGIVSGARWRRAWKY